MKYKLKPCPFCGGEAQIIKIDPRLHRPSRNRPYSVVCVECDCYLGFDEDYGGEFNSKKEALEAWNRRVNN